MSGAYTDMFVHTKTRDRLKKFAAEKGLTIAELLEHICDMLEKTQQAKKEEPKDDSD